jgi:aspartate-semialdehyde dehydrogenase
MEVGLERWRVGILGATGLVGQRLIQRLQGHPWFELCAVAASDRSVGRPYREAARWTLSAAPPESVAEFQVRRCERAAMADCDLVLSGLDAAAAKGIEPEFAAGGVAVVSNSSAYRMAPGVPILVPEVNASHLALVEAQQEGGGGFLVTNPNCSVTGLALALAPLHRTFGVRRVVVATLQALSGAGLEGPRGLEALDNVIPFIPGEEEKLETELDKIFGTVRDGGIQAASISVSAHCHRVPTLDGHLEAVSVELEQRATPEEAAEALRKFRGDTQGLDLPSSPDRPIEVRDERDRPQTRLDRDAGGGMTVVVGRIRRCPVLTLRLEVLSHNTVRGAAGGTLLNAELLAAKGLLPRRRAG